MDAEDATTGQRLRFWSLNGDERTVLLFVRRIARTRGKLAVYWDDDFQPEIAAVIERHVRQRALYRSGAISFDPDADPPLLVTEDGQLAFLRALSSLRDRGFLWEKVVYDSEGPHLLYKPLA